MFFLKLYRKTERMTYNPGFHKRKSYRFKGFDYGCEAFYFITLCTYERKSLFGEIIDGKMCLSPEGEIAEQCWLNIPKHYPHAQLHEFVIMPDHVHGIIEIKYNVGIGAKNFSPEDNSNMPEHDGITPEHDSSIPKHNINIPEHNSSMPEHDSNMPEYDGNTLKISEKNMDVLSKFSPKFKSPEKTIGSIVRGFKIGVTKWMRSNTNVVDVWQRNYHDRIIRDENQFQNTTMYIRNNPINWGKKKEQSN